MSGRYLADVAMNEEEDEQLGGEGDESQHCANGVEKDAESIVETTTVVAPQPATYRPYFSQPQIMLQSFPPTKHSLPQS